MMQALDHGPAYLPDGLFTGTPARVLAGMKVHANTISHARLVALEDSFPRTRVWLGHERFHAQCRAYLDQPGVTAFELAGIGRRLPGYLAAHGHSVAGDLARFEWRWLQSCHAAEANPLRLAELAGLAPDALMTVTVRNHPAAAMERSSAVVASVLYPEVPGLDGSEAILIARPEGEVLVWPATMAMLNVFRAARFPTSIGNLLAVSCEPAGTDQAFPADCMQALIALLHAGALIRTEP